MCGLVSVLSKKHYGFTKQQTDIFSSLLFIDLLRGDDSTGVFVATNKGELALAKDATNSLDFLKTPEYGKLCTRSLKEGVAMVGHNRKATTGSVKDVNAHPFVVEDKIVLVHNGTLWGDHKKHADVEVDSHAIAHVLHQHGDVEKALQQINGAFALIWYDVDNQRVNFVRNSARPLWWMETDNEFIWSSEKNFLVWVQSRFNLQLSNKFPEISELPPYCLNTFTYNSKSSAGWDIDSKTLAPIAPTNPASMPWTWGRHPYACGYEMGDEDEPTFGVVQTRMVNSNNYLARDVNPIADWETKMVIEHERTITYSEFYRIKDTFVQDKKVPVFAIDYSLANGSKDNLAAGWYLYLASSDYPNFIFKKWYAGNDITEEQLINYAASQTQGIAEVGGIPKWDIIRNPTGGPHQGMAFCRAAEFIEDNTEAKQLEKLLEEKAE